MIAADRPLTTERFMRGLVASIENFTIHDGPGIRTTVFLKGCPLRCVWCHNPEMLISAPELLFASDLCVGCGACVRACPRACHSLGDGRHTLDRDRCVGCGACARECCADALVLVGRLMSIDDVMTKVLKDEPFHRASGGGLSISGGEPMSQFEFTQALLKAAKDRALHTCLDTCGFAPTEQYLSVREHVDIFLYDLKETDPSRHTRCTGVPLAPIIENLLALDANGAATILRCPIIPGLNDRPDHLDGIASVAERLTHIAAINVLPYNPMGRAKAECLGRIPRLPDFPCPNEQTIAGWIERIGQRTRVPVTRG